MYFAQARHYWKGRTRKVRCLTIHTMECPESGGRARWCINWFASLAAPVASTHYAVDSAEAVQGVREGDTAFCTPGVNADGISIEHAGYAAQGNADWADDYSQQMLHVSARLAADICTRNDIPIRHLSDAQLAAGERGIIGHIQATNVYKLSSHWDPGEHFPWEQYIDLVRKYAGEGDRPSRATTRKAPAFPLATGHAYAVNDFTVYTHSGVRRADRAAIRSIQKKVGCEADGIYGPVTESHVKAWQSKHHLTVDGQVGPKTWKAMF